MISIAVAILVGLIAAFIQSLGLTLQRKSHLENELSANPKSDWQRPLWIIGFIIFITSNTLGSIFQLGALPIVVLAPLGGVSLVWNAIFARIILQDHFSRYLILGTVLIASGAVLIAIFGSVEQPNHSLEELLQLYSRSTFVIWFSLELLTLLAALLFAHLTEYTLNSKRKIKKRTSDSDLPTLTFQRHSRRWSEPINPEATEEILKSQSAKNMRHVSFAATILNETEDAGTALELNQTRLWIGIAYGSISGTLSGLCLLFAKTGTELLILTLLYGQNQFKKLETYLIVLALIVAAVLQLWYLNKSLRLLGPTLICPLAFCFYNLSSILNGLFFYDQWKLLSISSLLLMSLGIIVLLIGVWIVSLKSADTEEEDRPDITAADENASERTPLMAEPMSFHRTLSQSMEMTDQHVHAPESGLDIFRRMLRDHPAGLAIGLAAPSPGFAIKPSSSRRFTLSPTPASADMTHSTRSLPPIDTHRRSFSLSNSLNLIVSPTNTSPVSPMSEFGASTSIRRHPSRQKRRSLGRVYYVGLESNSPNLSSGEYWDGQNGVSDQQHQSALVQSPTTAPADAQTPSNRR